MERSSRFELNCLVASLCFGAPAAAQCSEVELTASDGTCEDELGISLYLSADTLLAGAGGELQQGSATGSVYVFERGPSGWSQVDKLVASDAAVDDTFGVAVAFDQGWAIIGAPGNDEPVTDSGTVYFFERTPAGWVERQIEECPAPASFAHFGDAVGISGTVAAVGAAHLDGTLPGTGLVFVYELSGTTWTLVQPPLEASDGATDDCFGEDLVVDGDRMVVGAEGHDHAGPGTGAVYVFERQVGGQWAEVHEITAPSSSALEFGDEVDLDGDRLVSDSNDAGSMINVVHVFDFDGSSWQLAADLVGTGVTLLDSFGTDMRVSGSRVAVGAPGWEPTPTGAMDTGAVFLFERGPSGWAQTEVLVSSNAQTFDVMGEYAVEIDGTTVAGGSLRDDAQATDAGSVVVFEVGGGLEYCQATPNSTGAPAQIVRLGCGPASLAANDLVLSASLVPNQFFIFFFGPDPIETPFGNGYLCIGGGLTRILPPTVASGNVATFAVDLPTVGITGPGTRYFQCWYRDPSAGGTSFNTSDGLSVTFTR